MNDLQAICRDIRCDTLRCIGHLGVGHLGGCLSVVELLGVLYFEAMRIDPQNPRMPGRAADAQPGRHQSPQPL